jgi:hypothetical protein
MMDTIGVNNSKARSYLKVISITLRIGYSKRHSGWTTINANDERFALAA